MVDFYNCILSNVKTWLCRMRRIEWGCHRSLYQLIRLIEKNSNFHTRLFSLDLFSIVIRPEAIRADFLVDFDEIETPYGRLIRPFLYDAKFALKLLGV